MTDMPEFPEGPPTEPPGGAPPPVDLPVGPPAEPPADVGATGLRIIRRPEPRLATALAAAGCALAVSGVFSVSGDALDGDGFVGGSQVPGVVLSLLVLAAGLALLARAPGGALRTAGSVAAVLAVPSLVFFVTFEDGAFPPYSTEGILAVSAAAWIALHLVGPAAGRAFPLGAGLIAAWLLVLQLLEEPFTSPFELFFPLVVESTLEESGDFTGLPGSGLGPTFDAPDATNMGFITMLFGAAMAVAGHRLDRAGQRGRATAFAVAAVVMLPLAVLLLAQDLEPVGSGLLLAAIGLVIAASGALRGRRFTNWAGGAFVFAGIGVVLDDLLGDSASSIGLAALVTGSAIVFGAHVLASSLGEADELIPGPSTLRAPSGTTGATDPPPPAVEL